MEPVEINAGAWYLRALRADERIDDRPALALAGITDPDHVRASNDGWRDESRFTWAIAEPTTGTLIGEVVVTPLGPDEGRLTGWTNPGLDEAFETAAAAVRRFASGMLGLDCAQG